MSLIETCCFYFSTRLGSIIVGILNLIQIIVWCVLVFICWNNTDIISDYIDDLLISEEVYAVNTLKSIQDNPHYFLGSITGFFLIFAVTCVAMIFGAFKFKIYMVYPFVVFDFIYITSMLIIHIAILVMKKKELGLGFLILHSVVGEFIFLYLYYTWICVVGYCQIVHELRKRMEAIYKVKQESANFTVFYKEFS